MIPPVNLSLPLEEMDNNNRSIGTGVFPLAAISERPGHNPRKDYGEHDGTFASLVESIKQFGLLQPPVIIPTSTNQDAWYVVSGHRRIAAARAAGLVELRCLELGWEWTTDESGKDLARETLASYTEAEQSIYALIENLQRKELNCIEVAEGVHHLELLGKTQEEIGRWIGRSQGAVSKLSRLLTLPDGVRAHLRTGELSQSHGEELLPLLGESFLTGEIEALASRAAEQQLTANGLRHVVREKIERATPKQTSIDDVTELEHSAPNTDGFDSELDARIAKTLASTKGLDKEPAPAPKETNGLTRKDSDKAFAAAMAPDPDVVPLSERPSPTPAPASSANMLEIEPRYLKVLADLSLTREYLQFRIGDILGDIIERRARELGVLPLEPVAPVTAEVFPVFEVPVTQEVKPETPAQRKYDAAADAVWRKKRNEILDKFRDGERVTLSEIEALGELDINCVHHPKPESYLLERHELQESGLRGDAPEWGKVCRFTVQLSGGEHRVDYVPGIGDFDSAGFHGNKETGVSETGYRMFSIVQSGREGYATPREWAVAAGEARIAERLNGKKSKPTKRAEKAESAPAEEVPITTKPMTPSEAGEAQRQKELADQQAAAERKAQRQKEHEAKLAAKSETKVTFRVSYCYPQRGEWQGGGECEIEDGTPAIFESLSNAREFAAEDSARNPRFLIHVTIWTEHLDRQYDRCQQRGDMWFFRGQSVPGGASDSLPTPERLVVVGCVVEELCQAEEEHSASDLFGMDEAQTTTDMVSDMAGRLV